MFTEKNIFVTRKKSFFKTKKFGLLLILAALAFGYWVSTATDGFRSEEMTASGKAASKDIGDVQIKGGNSVKDEGFSPEENRSYDEGTGKNGAVSGEYYLVKAKNDVVSVYYYDGGGNETLLAEADISFSLISFEDQNMLSKGVVLKSEEELRSFLEDFES